MSPQVYSNDIDDIPEEFICPISHELMKQPVMSRSGRTYEKAAILKWIHKHGTCPMTRKPLFPSDLVSNRNLQFRILQWKCEQEKKDQDDADRRVVSDDDESSSSSSKDNESTRNGNNMNFMYIYKALERDMRTAEDGKKKANVDITDAVSRNLFFQDGMGEVLEILEGW